MTNIILCFVLLFVSVALIFVTVLLKNVYKTLCRLRGVKDSYKQKLENLTVKYEAAKERNQTLQKIVDKNKWNKHKRV